MNRPTLISAATVARLKERSVLRVRAPYLVTPTAADLARSRQIRIEEIATGVALQPEQKDPVQTDEETSAAITEPVIDDPLAARIESTRLATETTEAEVKALCGEAVRHGFAGVCVPPLYVPLAVRAIGNETPRVITVCGFPLGTNASAIKAAEARVAESEGAHEIDMVLAVGLLRAGRLQEAWADIRAVRDALSCAATVLKVIIEAPLLTEEEIVTASVLAQEGGADYVKTGTGFAGPATVEQVRLIARTVRENVKIKAAGGIRSRQTAEALIAAGAHRIGTSCAAALLAH